MEGGKKSWKCNSCHKFHQKQSHLREHECIKREREREGEGAEIGKNEPNGSICSINGEERVRKK